MNKRNIYIIIGFVMGLITYSFIVSFIFKSMAKLTTFPMPWYPWVLGFQGLSGNNIGDASGQLIISFGIPLLTLIFLSGTIHKIINGKNSGMPDARWSKWKDIKNSELDGNSGVILGKFNNKYIMSSSPTHIMVAAPTRSGKGVGIVTPNLLNFNGSIICLDLKHENYRNTSGFRAQNSKVYKWSPMSEDGKSHCYNPFSSISKDKHRRVTELQIFAKTLIQDPPKGDPMWTSEARALFIGLALYVFDTEENPTIGAINRLLGAETDLGEICQQIVKTHESLPSSIIKPLNNFANKATKERSGVKTSINTALNLWDNPAVDSATSKSDFDISKIRKERSTVYVSVGTEEIQTLAPLLRIFFEQTIKTLVRKEPEQDEPHQVLIVLDEFHMLGSMEIMKTAFTLLAGYNVRVIAITQSLSWLETTYDRATRNGILSCCAHQIFFAANDEDTKSYVSNACGERTINIESTSKRNSLGYEPETRNINLKTVPLITKQETHNLDKNKGIILVEAGLPIMADKIKFYEDKVLSARANIKPSIVPKLDIIEKTIPKFDNTKDINANSPNSSQTSVFDTSNTNSDLNLNKYI